VRKLFWIIVSLLLCGWLATANADTYTLTDGTSVTGDVLSFNDEGATFHTPDDKYTDRIPWMKFSQDSLRSLAKNPKITPFAQPFIEVPPAVHPQEPVEVHDVQRLQLPQKGSVIGGLFTSSLGIIALLLIYAANIYAGVEIAVFRSRPIGLVAITSAILPILGPIIFLSMPTYMPPGATEEDMQTETGAPPEGIAPTPQPGNPAQPATTESVQVAPAGGRQAASSIPETQVFQRGQFTFNRRFFETKFSGYFGMMRHGADKDMVLILKTPRAQHVVERITRISANEAHFEVSSGAARQEVMIPFGEIQEIQLKHKNA
jgi:hypothetical protein